MVDFGAGCGGSHVEWAWITWRRVQGGELRGQGGGEEGEDSEKSDGGEHDDREFVIGMCST